MRALQSMFHSYMQTSVRNIKYEISDVNFPETFPAGNFLETFPSGKFPVIFQKY